MSTDVGFLVIYTLNVCVLVLFNVERDEGGNNLFIPSLYYPDIDSMKAESTA